MTERRSLMLIDASARPRPDNGDEQRPIEELISGDLGAMLRRHLWRRKDVAIRTHDISVMRHPFNKAALLRLIARGSCWFEDEQGHKSEVGAAELLRLLGMRVVARWRRVHGERALRPQLDTLIADRRKPKRFGPGAVLYLRTDLVFGLRSGGSVTHTAGVINELARTPGGAVMESTNLIPMVSSAIDVSLIRDCATSQRRMRCR